MPRREDNQNVRPKLKADASAPPLDINFGESIWDPTAFADYVDKPTDLDQALYNSMYDGDDVHVPPPDFYREAIHEGHAHNEAVGRQRQQKQSTVSRLLAAAEPMIAVAKPQLKKMLSKEDRDAGTARQATGRPSTGYFPAIGDRRQENLTERSILINVYHLQAQLAAFNKIAAALDTGVYHAAIECYGYEWTYCGGDQRGTGITKERAGSNTEYEFDQTLYVGELPSNVSYSELKAVIGSMERDWKARDYHLIKKNCITFLAEVLEQLGHDPARIPPKVNSLMKVGLKASDNYYDKGLDKKFASGVVKAMTLLNTAMADPNRQAGGRR